MSADRVIRSVVPPEGENIRLDQYLAGRFTYRSRTGWQKTVREGGIRVNGNPVRASHLLRGGDVLEFLPAGEELQEPPVDPSYAVLRETEHFLAVNKPGDLPVHPSGRYFRHTLLSFLEEETGAPLHPVNRLDRETSGVVLFARTPFAARKLSLLLENGGMRKSYRAIVYGNFPETLEASGWLGPDVQSPVRKKRRFTFEPQTGEDVQTAETFFRLLETDGARSLVECSPRTGRFHQIRATLCSLGFPLVGDKLYGPDDGMYLRQTAGQLTDEDMRRLILPRQALHAERLQFRSPFTGEEEDVFAPLPADMASAVPVSSSSRILS